MAGHHVAWQQLRQCRTQGGPRDGCAAICHEEGDQLVDALFLAQDDGHGADARLVCQSGLDLPQLHPKPADLHLVVGAAQALHTSVGIDARQVPGAVQALVVRMVAPGVGQKFLRRQIGATEVADCHARTGDTQLTDLAAGQQHQSVFHRGADDKQAVIGQGPPDGDRCVGMEFCQAGRYGGFGGAVGVENLAAWCGPAVDQRLRAHFPAQVDHAQGGHVLAEQGQQGWYGVQHRDLVILKRQRQKLWVGGDLLGRNPQRGADQVADPDFFERHVESDRKPLVHAVIAAHAQHGVLAAQKVANAALADLDALGLAGGARGINHVGWVRGQRSCAAWQVLWRGQGAA